MSPSECEAIDGGATIGAKRQNNELNHEGKKKRKAATKSKKSSLNIMSFFKQKEPKKENQGQEKEKTLLGGSAADAAIISSDESDEERKGDNTSKKRKSGKEERRKIKRVLKDTELTAETLAAQDREKQRLEKVAASIKAEQEAANANGQGVDLDAGSSICIRCLLLYANCAVPAGVLINAHSPDEGEPPVEILPALAHTLKPHQVNREVHWI